MRTKLLEQLIDMLSSMPDEESKESPEKGDGVELEVMSVGKSDPMEIQEKLGKEC